MVTGWFLSPLKRGKARPYQILSACQGLRMHAAA